ncbi:chromosome segregation protein SMC [Shewanella alkalitolerans]|uniref:chromosome segregation protein SMC n=1 Tax=Shewanella alkalitolerans TaxID=2864209 RepID=UPI001C65FFCC|nr:chromosome segregation protein SMC [Shewanella alkalitolerans]QYJ96320.1 chromosome segregation protein SMC [Shewanella alkalitolerans]
MRLTQIKLAGFKSFVDVTKIPFNQPLTAIIGPNGCGKSNVIDAVRWVLGESSAKHLRGDSMADVIFNGSSARRPVSVASVELSFDNQQGRLGGQYASYQAIAVKRQVSRDGESSYFLNGQKCRRKDITDLFMGTGLGPRSYAIIEQGTISRLIESKPQELRVFIEEAAGISRYKERRRETENRIRHTRENLERLGDIRQELGRQIDKLAEQAEAARQYRALKQTERDQHAQLEVAKYLELSAQSDKLSQEIEAKTLTQSEGDAGREALSRNLTELKLKLDELERQEQQQVEAFYLNGNQIAKLEQEVKHRQQQDAHLKQRIKQDEDKLALLKAQEQALILARGDLDGRQHDAREAHQTLQLQLELLDEQLGEVELSLEQAQEAESQAKQAVNQCQLRLELTKGELKHKQSVLTQLKSQHQSASRQLEQLSHQDESANLALQHAQCERLAERVDELKGEIELGAATQSLLQEQARQTQAQVDALSQSLAEERGRLAVVKRILPQENVLQGRALWQAIQVTPGWEAAVDLLLDGLLTQKVSDKSSAKEIENESGFALSRSQKWTGLSSEVNLAPWLSRLTWVDNLSQAKAMLGSLEDDERIVTADGYIVGKGFVLQKAEQGSQLVQLKAEQQALELSIAASVEAIDERRAVLAEVNQALDEQRETLTQLNTSLQGTQLERERLMAQAQATQERIAQQGEQQARLEALLEEQTGELEAVEQSLSELTSRRDQDEAQLTELTRSADSQVAGLADRRAQHKALGRERQTLAQQSQQLQQSLQAINTEQALSRQQGEQLERQMKELAQELSELQGQLEGQDKLDGKLQADAMTAQLNDALARQGEAQAALDALRLQQAELQNQADEIGAKQKQQLGKLEHLTQAISALKLRREGIKGQIDSQLAQIKSQEVDITEVQATLDLTVSLSHRQKTLERTKAQIEHLGAINLAAIEEFEQQSQRKAYLDSQDADLAKALGSLEEAIRKIDRETKTRFKETFDRVNQDLGVLFPKVFGGGSAYLALTDDDLLETGVTIMARPPGKKNSTIHLLSGGEKALTALSLVFAIFRLNPAPFCMLDEVDAPLDDANVDRFCRLVKEMSQSVQFVYISHNKITMELADQLIGVTMHEPGVSRIVAVDIDEAVALADAV